MVRVRADDLAKYVEERRARGTAEEQGTWQAISTGGRPAASSGADYTDPSGVRHRFSTRATDKKAAATILAQRERDAAAQAAAGLASDAAGRTIEDLTWYLAVEAHTNTSGKQISAG